MDQAAHRRNLMELKAWASMDVILTTEQKADVARVTTAWLAWLDDPEHNPAPNPRVQKSYAIGVLSTELDMRGHATKARLQIQRQRLADPEPYDATSAAHLGWAMRENERRERMRHWDEYLD